MPAFTPKLLLLDIEGTTSSISFVTDVLFPYARRRLDSFLEENALAPFLLDTLEIIARDAGGSDFSSWCPHPWPSAEAREWLCAHLYRLMDADAKQTGLKQLQGGIWEKGYRNGSLRSHIFPEVPGMLRTWSRAGLPIAIYSSGSIAAQKLFFAHTEGGDLSPLFTGNYDTTIGSKREAASYRAIAADRGLAPARILFLSDVAEELDAARAAGLGTVLVERPGNRPVLSAEHPRIKSFEELQLARLAE